MIRPMALMLPLTAVLLAGCQGGESFRSVQLGQVEYEQAFHQAQEVMRQHFAIESADAGSGRIVARPRLVDKPADRRISATPARELALMRLSRQPQGVRADLRVEVQRLASTAMLPPFDEQYEVPNQTPAQGEAPLTAEQIQNWRTTGYDYQLEQQMLRDLERRLQP